MVTCGGNILVVVIIACTPALRSVTNALLVNLAMADLMVGLVQLLEVIRMFRPDVIGTYAACAFKMWLIIKMVLVSCASLLGE